MSWDGKIYDKYRVSHTDGTPLKGKKYFVLRLDSDDPVEAARVSAAMRAYKGELRNCDVGTADEQAERFSDFCDGYLGSTNYESCGTCPLWTSGLVGHDCELRWAQMPYETKGENK